MSTVDLRDRLHEAGFLPPDPSDRTLVNLMASVIRSRGGESPHPGFAGLDEEALAACRSLVLVLVDGLGWHQVEAAQRERPAPAFIHRRSLRATTVFPATTAVATTTLTTGASPAEHGVLGWYTHLPEIGLNTTILLGTLGFFGLGVSPESPDWGSTINDGRRLLTVFPHAALVPALSLMSLVLGLNLLADGLREESLRD